MTPALHLERRKVTPALYLERKKSGAPVSAPEESITVSVEKSEVAPPLMTVAETTHAMVTSGVATADTTTYAPGSETRDTAVVMDDAARRQRVAAIEEKRTRVIRLSWTVNAIAWMLLGIGLMFALLIVFGFLIAMGTRNTFQTLLNYPQTPHTL